MNERASENGRDAMKRGRSEGRWQNIMILFEKKGKHGFKPGHPEGRRKKKLLCVHFFLIPRRKFERRKLKRICMPREVNAPALFPFHRPSILAFKSIAHMGKHTCRFVKKRHFFVFSVCVHLRHLRDRSKYSLGATFVYSHSCTHFFVQTRDCF